MSKGFIISFLLTCIGFSGMAQRGDLSSGNPILPGDFADPLILQYRDTFYIYATTGTEATVWRSADFRHWKLTRLNWPTSMKKPDIWAPGVARGRDGKFYLYTSVDHNIYVGVADHPLGPFVNVLGKDSIFIRNRQYWNNIHSIDADCFIDDDGQAYLYWGSGFDFVDGVCAAGRLNPDMSSFAEPPVRVTPQGYFEGPHMMKRNGIYYLMYSDGLYYDSSYKVRYATSSSPMGPFKQGTNSPILTSSADGRIDGPGHHSTFQTRDGHFYIVYHRHVYPAYPASGGTLRQVCIDELRFAPDGSILPVLATQTGVPLTFVKDLAGDNVLKPVSVSSNTGLQAKEDCFRAFDDNFGSIWTAPGNKLPAWLLADYGGIVSIGSISPVFDQVMGAYEYRIQYSLDKKTWHTYAVGNNAQQTEWPVLVKKAVKARYVRITISRAAGASNRVGLWELIVNATK